MNRRRFFNLSFAAVGAAVVAPWAAAKAWAQTIEVSWKYLPFQTMTSDKSCAKPHTQGIRFYVDHSTGRMLAGTTLPGEPDLAHLIEPEAWVGGGVEPEWRSGRGTDD